MYTHVHEDKHVVGLGARGQLYITWRDDFAPIPWNINLNSPVQQVQQVECERWVAAGRTLPTYVYMRVHNVRTSLAS